MAQKSTTKGARQQSHRKRTLISENWRDKYVPAPKGIVVCKYCSNVYLKKKWRAAGNQAKGAAEQKTVCPACAMLKDGRYEGELVIKNIPRNVYSEVLLVMNAYGKRAIDINPQHRIIKIEKNIGGYRVTTTENQMAARLGKHLKQVFKKINLKVTRSEEPFKLERVYATFL